MLSATRDVSPADAAETVAHDGLERAQAAYN